MDSPMPVANKTTLVENLLRVIAASFGDSPHSLNLFQSGIWEGSAEPPARKRHPVIGRSSCRGHDASSRCVRPVNGAPTSFPHQAATPVDGRAFEGHWGPLSPPSVGATTRDEQWTLCRDMIRGSSKGLRAHFTRATISACRLPRQEQTSICANRARAFRPYTEQPHPGEHRRCDLLSGIGPDLTLGSGSL